MTTHADEVQTRIAKVERMKALGVNPFAHRFSTSHQIGEVVNTLSQTEALRTVEDVIATPTDTVALAGRVMLHRSFGKICFATISDGTGKIQVLFSRENCAINVDGIIKTELSENGEPLSAYKFVEKLIDLGDFIGVRGELFYTHK